MFNVLIVEQEAGSYTYCVSIVRYPCFIHSSIQKKRKAKSKQAGAKQQHTIFLEYHKKREERGPVYRGLYSNKLLFGIELRFF